MNEKAGKYAIQFAERIDMAVRAEVAHDHQDATPPPPGTEGGPGLSKPAATTLEGYPQGRYELAATGEYDASGHLIPKSISQVAVSEQVLITDHTGTQGYAFIYEAFLHRQQNGEDWTLSSWAVPKPGMTGRTVSINTAQPDRYTSDEVDTLCSHMNGVISGALQSPSSPIQPIENGK